MTNRVFSDKINLSIGKADFLCQNTPLVCEEEHTVFPIDRRGRGFLLEDKMILEPLMPKRIRNKISRAMKGKIPWCKGKHKYSRTINSSGYVIIRDKGISNYEHRLVIEKYIGRKFKRGEVSHHINGIKTDNRPENLMMFVNDSAHLKFEWGKKIDKSAIIFDGRKLKKKKRKKKSIPRRG